MGSTFHREIPQNVSSEWCYPTGGTVILYKPFPLAYRSWGVGLEFRPSVHLGPYCRSYLLRGDVRLTRALWEIIDLLSLEIADSTERRTQVFRFGIHFLSPIFHYVFPMTDGPVPGPELLCVSRLHYAVHKNPY